jgi:CsoR family transcriptional regulator, copper-sensing transcriptional repressor
MNYDRKSTSHKLKIIAGQIEGLSKMIDEDQYCIELLSQSLSIQRALQRVDKQILKEHINGCVVDQMKGGEEERAAEELVRIYSLYRKS